MAAPLTNDNDMALAMNFIQTIANFSKKCVEDPQFKAALGIDYECCKQFYTGMIQNLRTEGDPAKKILAGRVTITFSAWHATDGHLFDINPTCLRSVQQMWMRFFGMI